MAQAQVSNTIRDLNGHALAQTVTVDIAPIGTGPFITPEGNELVGPLTFQTDKAGNWTQGIERTDTLSPQGTLFLVTEHLPSGKHTYKIAVPGPGPYKVSDPGIIQSTLPIPTNAPWITASLPFAFGTPGGPLEVYLNAGGGISSGSPLDLLGGQAGFAGAQQLTAQKIAAWLLPSSLTPIATGGTITLTGTVTRVQTTTLGTDNVTNVVLAPGAPGQLARIMNEGIGSIAFNPTPSLSHLAAPTRLVIAGTSFVDLHWNDKAAIPAWYEGLGPSGSARIVVAAAGASAYAKSNAKYVCSGTITGGVMTPTTVAMGITATLANTSTTAMTVNATADLAAVLANNITLVIEAEHIRLTAGSGTSWTVTRGVDGTTAATHTSAAVSQIVNALVGASGDEVQLQAANDELEALGYGTVEMVGPNFIQAKEVQHSETVTFEGQGWSTKLKRGNNVNCNGFVNKHQNVQMLGQIRRLTYDGNKANNGNSPAIGHYNVHDPRNKAGISYYNVIDPLVDDVLVVNVQASDFLAPDEKSDSRAGIQFSHCWRPTARNCEVANCNGMGLRAYSNYFDSASNTNRTEALFVNNLIHDDAFWTLDLDGTVLRATVMGNRIWNCVCTGTGDPAIDGYREGLVIDEGAFGFTVTSNQVSLCLVGITFQANFASGVNRGHTISGNACFRNTHQGININSNAVGVDGQGNHIASVVRDTLVIGNLLYDNGTIGYAFSAGIQTNTAGDPVLGSTITGVTIALNRAFDTGIGVQLYGLHLTTALNATNDTIVEFNGLRGNVTKGILQDGGGTFTGKIRLNPGWVTENVGLATIAQGATSVVVTHAMDAAPASMILTGKGNGTSVLSYEWGSEGATTFTIYASAAAPAGGKTVSWEAKAANWY